MSDFIALPFAPDVGLLKLTWTSAVVSAGVLAILYSQSKKDGFNYLPGFPFVGAWSFFTKRAEFLDVAITANRSGKTSKFNLRNHNIIIATNEDGRKVFYGTRGLSVSDGYAALWGTAPSLNEALGEVESTAKQSNFFMKRLQPLLHRDRLHRLIPELFSDLNVHLESWPQSGHMDPFTHVWNVIFHLTNRALGARELADDLSTVKELATLYWSAEQDPSPSSVLLPWIPSRTKQQRMEAMGTLYTTFADTINKRISEGRSENDAVQFMLDQDDTVEEIAPFIMQAIFTGTITTGILVCWILIYLHTYPEWDAKIRQELEALLNEYSPDATLPMYARFSQVPVEAWEGSTPVLEAVITETNRMVISGSNMRRNMGEDIEVNGLKVKQGEFMLYPMGSLHHDADHYPDPLRWDPSRWADPTRLERERSQWSFLGWGVGLHPCLGMRIAKLDLKLAVSLFIQLFEYSRVDKNGNPSKDIPVPNLNDLHRVAPKGEGRYFQYKRRPSTVKTAMLQ
ncbi:hypothetical protein SERLA73DRAFT_75348 [Serpula lacrymans var. lacrymans S7.3]|uniref:Cytochrome P450 n=2 Tax=Serpula lacrymans var. lacrymans TaxID=341189 RepID=F8Q3C7_SERL3|nr:putative monooxygenase [Serpula lacrymans var. lacrymans S7.9]EGN97688.1 hypothetical protein SERLA73DRAFT_75348 [Serpula lacrymans var. lacrymans S7.3]EGO23282.1 putative monooxygenase [Serpula lacrymans var. lacrymans S7.9]